LNNAKSFLIKTLKNGEAMKRVMILSLILISTLALGACSTKPNANANIPNTGIQSLQTTLAAAPTDKPSSRVNPTQSSRTESPTEQPTQTPTKVIPTPTPTNSEQARSGVPGIINESGVNLRIGPGFSYQVLKLMPKGLEVDVKGRSTNGIWLEVHLPDGSGGWAFAAYVDMDVAIAILPVSQAEGGPISEGPAGGAGGSNRLDVTIYILDNQATLQVNNFPSNAEINASLGLPGKGADLTVADGKTDINGSAELTFEMPARWSNSKPTVESELLLVVSTSDGSFSRSIQVQYLRG